ncbi:hypothetical protein Q4Q34_15285 [Flavivirga abyssicola]|uniref:hypothetical protein n=1 Tax=Flavivirga abyssicola TaxID=3063533 RepID=UPI0026E03DF2|nr:hypothetical protein [Flavivirga sp. MEBiC07777]WVK12579.1 hypothetical protein Q4Q34_15285 [Flavivirga sp. MEBiC07777]
MKKFYLVFVSIMFLNSFLTNSQGFKNFITVEGNQLLDGDKTFRFLSYNVPTMNYVEDNMDFEETNPYGIPSEFELRDLFETLKLVGGNVARTYTIPVRNKNFPAESVTYVEGPGKFNEEAFKAMDTVLALAREYKIRLIIPLVNNWEWMGGRPNYADFRNKNKDEFWTDKQLIKDFKKTIKYVLNRTNTVTGIKYKDDKTIMAWESGNELQNPPAWGIEIARYVKSIDKNHLFMDGFFAIHDGNKHSTFVQQYSIDEPAIDIISTHHYEPSSILMIDNLKKTVALVNGKKPLMIGEFGFIGVFGIKEVLDYVIDEKALCGALIWSLRRHDSSGGFYHHTEPFATVLYRAYHWPGFKDGEVYGERETLKLYREKSFEIRNLDVPDITAPKPPKLLDFSETPKFSWQGSAGASGYDIERSHSEDGPWDIIEHNIDDVDTPGFDLYSDESATIGQSYYYRVRALNQARKSEPSNVVGPIEIKYLTRVDYAKNLMALERQKGLEIKTGDCRSYKEAFSRMHGEKKAEGVYVIPARNSFKEIRVFNYESSKEPNVSFYSSENGIDYQEISFDVDEYKSNEDNYDYLVPRKYVISNSLVDSNKQIKYIKFKASDTIDIVRVELEYQ